MFIMSDMTLVNDAKKTQTSLTLFTLFSLLTLIDLERCDEPVVDDQLVKARYKGIVKRVKIHEKVVRLGE